MQGGDRGGGDDEQLIVERDHPAPVGRPDRGGVAVHGGDRGLDLVRAGPAQLQAAADEGLSLADQVSVPERAVLRGERDQIAVGVRAGRSPRVGEHQQREQAQHLGFVGQQFGQQASEPDRLGAQVVADQTVPAGSGVPLGEDEIDDGEDGCEAAG